ncbi:MAG: EVE domain-containing protein [Planctomycetes bacterium]|nr:EVE domain-containing protein [Planctomycetota bacterium]
MPRRFWLMKVEPSVLTIAGLRKAGTTSWEGVRNYQARNWLRDEFQVGDGVLFYQSSADPSGVTGLAEVVRAGYPDHFAQKKGHEYYDPKASPDNPIWYMVDIRFVEQFPRTVTLADLKRTKGLENMLVLRKGQRLSIMPVTAAEYDTVCGLGRGV